VGALASHVTSAKTRNNGEGFDWARLLKQGLNQAKGIKIRFPRAWITSPLFSLLSRMFFRFYFDFRARGLKNIPDQPCIIVPNHQSFFDGMFVASLLKLRKLKDTFFYAKASHVKGGLLAAIAKHNNIIVMDINKNLKESIIRVAEVLRSQRSMIIFPEGTRTKDGSLGDFKRMFAILARELNVPVVPVSIRGAFEALPRGARFPKPFRSVSVEFLPPVFPEGLDYDSLTEKVRAAINSALGPRLGSSQA
jgi:long-chain acyl-CoA synthetase